MELLRAASIALVLAGCYSPALADCAVTCGSEADCGDGQTCDEQHLCAGAGVRCNSPEADAAVTADAPLEPDATPQTMLRIHVMDQGEVEVPGHAPCTMDEDCTFAVDEGVPLTLTATPKGNRIFEKWEEACAGQRTSICTLTPTGNETNVTAKFKREP